MDSRLPSLRPSTLLLPLCFQLLGSAQQPQDEQRASSTEDFPDSWHCPKCGGLMKVIERLSAAEIQLRSPPRLGVALSNWKTPRSSERSVLLCQCRPIDPFFVLLHPRFSRHFVARVTFCAQLVMCRGLRHSLGTA